MRTERTFARLSSTFGVLTLVLSAVGPYGVVANAVSRRRKELGIRLALGAEPRRILRLVLGEAGLLVALGAAVGLPCAFWPVVRFAVCSLASSPAIGRVWRPHSECSSSSRRSRRGFPRAEFLFSLRACAGRPRTDRRQRAAE